MNKILSCFLVAVVLIFAFAGCTAQYSSDDFIGKSSSEILAEFGAFDCVTMPAGGDGLHKSCRCGYTVKEKIAGFWGDSPEILLFISFDENGIATKCEEGYRPGG